MDKKAKAKARLKSKKLLMAEVEIEINILDLKALNAPLWELPEYICSIVFLKQKLAAIRNTDKNLFCLNSKKLDGRRLRRKNRKAGCNSLLIVGQPK